MIVGIYGLGRFGLFWALTLSKIVEVQAFSKHSPVPKGIKAVSEDELSHSDILFLCNSISSMEEICKRLSGKLKKGTIIADTCSVKVFPIRTMLKYLPEDVHIVGTHPMFGPDSGKNGVKGFPIALCPVRIDESKLGRVVSLFSKLELRIERLSAEEHDYEAAYSQGITHFVGRTLNLLALKPSRISTAGYEDLLDIIHQTCNDQWQLFIDLQKFNPYTEDMRKKLHSSIEQMLLKLDSIDSLGER